MSGWTIPAESLDAGTLTTANTPVAGTVLDLGQVLSSHGIQYSIDLVEDGAQISVSVLGSLDGVEFWQLWSVETPAPASSPGTYNGGASFTVAVRYIQASAVTTSSASPVAEVTTWHTARP